jgi:hypothetical protein
MQTATNKPKPKTKRKRAKTTAAPVRVLTPENFAMSVYFEDLIKIREQQPATFAIFSPSLKTALHYYEEAKRRAVALYVASEASKKPDS